MEETVKTRPLEHVAECFVGRCRLRNVFLRGVSKVPIVGVLGPALSNRLHAPGQSYGRTQQDAARPSRCFAVHARDGLAA